MVSECLTVVESVAGATGGEPHTEEGPQGVVTPLALQTVVLARLTLVDVLALPSLLLEAHWTRVVLGEILGVLTGVITLGVDTYRALAEGNILFGKQKNLIPEDSRGCRLHTR